MIRFSRKEDYAIILVNKLALHYNKNVVPLSDVAKEYDISILFLRNLAMELRSAGIIKAIEGKNGGYFLIKDPSKIKMGDVLGIFSKRPMLECCHHRGSKTEKQIKCPKEDFCQPGFIWRKLNKEFLDKIYRLSVTDFMHYKNINE